ncbi:hypothetical protein M0D21_17410 [Aquimarina sp. D1M17]|uniref:hypothetical protein n=1 Tax=Aquimarina acroporae TaxID=2937283 RepID=UPI0020C0445A|nr:hypothetical protein [Aquimarina acroporae]MCK8523363.1 hypothetical protein [Aquimarina acroporae]
MTKGSYNLLYTGIILFVLYVTQYIFDLKWQWLYTLQLDENYKRWSGLLISIFILFQWVLTITRTSKKLRPYSQKYVVLHKWIGVISPVFFYVHALEFGYGYLALLSYVFFTNMLLGTVNLDIIKSHKNWVFQSWMITHVALSIVITFIMFFHIGVVFYYK